MKKQIAKLSLALVMVFSVLVPINTTQANAQSLVCDIFPFLEGLRFADSLCTGDIEGGADTALTTGQELVQFGLSLVFVGIIAFAIFIIIKAALKYIRSEGNEEEVQEAQKAIKNVFVGIGALIVGVIGLVIILGIFNSGTVNPLDTEDSGDIQDTLLGN